jgi:hypothetical protein
MRPTVERLKQLYRGQQCFSSAETRLSKDLSRVTLCDAELQAAAHLLAARPDFRKNDPALLHLSPRQREAKIAYDVRDEQGVRIIQCPTM